MTRQQILGTSVPTGSMDVNDAWGDIDLLSLTNTPAPIHAPTPAPGLSMVADTAQDPFDFSAFGAPLAQRAPSPSSPRSRSRTPGDFDFGHEGSGGLRSDDDSEGEDLLGDFGRPVESRPQVGLRLECALTIYQAVRLITAQCAVNFASNRWLLQGCLASTTHCWSNCRNGFHTSGSTGCSRGHWVRC